jgi:DNA (cytosine-5)-methyltransferase 1
METNTNKYTCDKCGKEFKQKSHHTSHLNRKTPCVTDKKLKEYNLNKEIVPKHDNISKKKFIDLFCGIGGFHQALKSLDLECVFACDIDKNCREVYKKNYGLEPASDITKVDEKKLPDFDIICAGFPCQAFSNAGNKQNFNDKRGMLFEHILRIAVEKKPSFMFLENVKHIKKISDGQVFKHILTRIDESGYYVDENKSIFELSPHQFGIPQHRERIIFVCIRKDLYIPENKIEIIPSDVPMNMEGIIEKTVDDKYKISKDVENILNVWDEMVQVFETNQNMSPTILCNEFHNVYTPEEFALLPEWKRDYITRNKDIYKKYKSKWDTWYTKNKELLTRKEIFGKLEWQAGKKKENDSIWNYFIQLRQSGIRVKKNDYFPTLVAIVQIPIYAKEKRYITPRECARLQAFPDSFIMHESDNIAYKQFGNSVCVDVVKFVMETVLKLYKLI